MREVITHHATRNPMGQNILARSVRELWAEFCETLRRHEQLPAGEPSARRFDELRSWQPEPLSPQDDHTWIIIDIVPSTMIQ